MGGGQSCWRASAVLAFMWVLIVEAGPPRTNGKDRISFGSIARPLPDDEDDPLSDGVPIGRPQGHQHLHPHEVRSVADLELPLGKRRRRRKGLVNEIGHRIGAFQRSSSAVFREAKGLLSSELESVILKATRPDDNPIKPKHLEVLLSISYQTPTEFDPFQPVLRKLWAKMREGDYRTTLKALYIVHRYAACGAPEQAANLQIRLVDMSRTVDSRSKRTYFDLASLPRRTPPMVRAYASYVLYRATSFAPSFPEVAILALPPEGLRLSPSVAQALEDSLLTLFRLASDIELEEEDEEVTKLTATCVEGVYFDIQQLLESMADHLGVASSMDERELRLVKRFEDVYRRGVEMVNRFVARHAELVAPSGVILTPLLPVSDLVNLPPGPSIVEEDVAEGLRYPEEVQPAQRPEPKKEARVAARVAAPPPSAPQRPAAAAAAVVAPASAPKVVKKASTAKAPGSGAGVPADRPQAGSAKPAKKVVKTGAAGVTKVGAKTGVKGPAKGAATAAAKKAGTTGPKKAQVKSRTSSSIKKKSVSGSEKQKQKR